MNQVHREAITRQLVENLSKLLDATITKQIVLDSYGKSEKRIIISYESKESS